MSSAILYTFRRCPYAMRARIGLHLSALNPEVREIELRNKPAEMLLASPKATVPVLIIESTNLDGSKVLDESIDVLKYSLVNYPNENSEYLCTNEYMLLITSITDKKAIDLINLNDNQFKPWLDKYKYADRFLDHSQDYYRDKACEFIEVLESNLTENNQLMAGSPTIADYAIFPFVRQFAHVNKNWFLQSPYVKVKQWLEQHIESELFKTVMTKHPLWLDNKTGYISLK